MKKISRAVALAALGFVLTGTAQATTLYTPPASAEFAGEWLYCGVVNVSTTKKAVTIEACDYGGATVDIFADTLQPGVGSQYPMFGTGIAYCKFTFTGPKNSVRASAVYMYDNTNNNTITIPAQ